MTTLTRPAAPVKAAAAVLFDSARPARRRRPFALGLAPERPRRPEPTPEDRRWAAAILNADARDYCLVGQAAPPVGLTSAELDELAAMDQAMSRYERGFGF